MFELMFSLLLVAQALDDRTLLKPYPQEPLLNEVIAFETVAGHKFNLESKNNCGNGFLVFEDANSIQCQMSAPGTSELQLYVCDKANTFCRREIFKLKTLQPKTFWGWVNHYKNTVFGRRDWSAPFYSPTSQVPATRGFIVNDLKAAEFEAQKNKKQILVFFTELTCDACRDFQEMTLATDEFQELSKENVFLQMDLDMDIDTMKKFSEPKTPALIVLSKNSKELGRTTQWKTAAELKSWLKKLPEVPTGAPVDDASTPSLAFGSGDKNYDSKALEKTRVQNTDDFSYDYFEAKRALDKKKYQEALVFVDKALARAKNRGWQRTFLLKIEILEAANNKSEALKIIEELLSNLKLPRNPDMKVHTFVQALRKKQFLLLPQSPAKL